MTLRMLLRAAREPENIKNIDMQRDYIWFNAIIDVEKNFPIWKNLTSAGFSARKI